MEKLTIGSYCTWLLFFNLLLKLFFLFILTHSIKVMRPEPCCAATMLQTGTTTSTLWMGSMSSLSVSLLYHYMWDLRVCVSVCVKWKPVTIFDRHLRPPPSGNSCHSDWIYWQREPLCQLWCQVCHSNWLHHTSVLLHWYGHCQVSCSRHLETHLWSDLSILSIIFYQVFLMLIVPLAVSQHRVTLRWERWWTLLSAPSQSWPFTSQPWSEVTMQQTRVYRRLSRQL